MNKRRLLIVTQAVDIDDPILGFFHRWIEEFAAHTEKLTVICLREGRHRLPPNVSVYSLGKEKGGSRITYIWNFYRYIWTLRREYDAVFVHMNPEYVVLGGLIWGALQKRVALWYTHKSVTWYLHTAALLADRIFSASKESIRINSKKIQITGHGIDTEFFRPDPTIDRTDPLLSVGRLMPSKRHDLAIQEAAARHLPLRIAGEGPLREDLAAIAKDSGANVTFLGGVSQEELRDEYRRAATLIHRSETGSLDKVVLEAAACGCRVDTTDPALAHLPLSPEYVSKHHSLQNLISCIMAWYVSEERKNK